MGGMKQCTKCLETKPFDMFRKNDAMLDGHTSWCKPCQNRAGEQSKKKDIEAFRAKERAWYAKNKEAINERRRKLYVEKHGERPLLTDQEVRMRSVVRRKTRRYLAKGLLVKTPCHVCGSLEVEAHHADYSRPLDVVWLCKKHHKELHDGVMMQV